MVVNFFPTWRKFDPKKPGLCFLCPQECESVCGKNYVIAVWAVVYDLYESSNSALTNFT